MVMVVYGGVEGYCKELGELRWLLRESRQGISDEIESFNERVKFK